MSERFVTEGHYSLLLDIICSTAVVLNIILLKLIISHTPKSLKDFSVLLIAHAVTDIVQSFATWGAKSFNIPLGGSFVVYMFHGVCRHIGARFCLSVFYLQLLMNQLSIHFLFVSFFYRLYTLKYNSRPWRSTILLAIFTSFPTFLMIGVFFSLISENKNFIPAKKVAEGFRKMENVVFAGADLTGIFGFASLGWNAALTLFVDLGVILIWYNVRKYLNSRRKLGRNSKKLHRDVIKTLILQCILPGLKFFGTCCFVYHLLTDKHTILQQVHPIAINTVYFMDPLFTMFTIKPYRKKIFELIRRAASPIWSIRKREQIVKL